MGPEVNAATDRHIDAQPPRMVTGAPLTVADGDVVVTFEVAGIWRGGPGLTAPTTQALPEYRVSIRGETGVLEPIFEIYDRAVADGDALAADRKVRLFYEEGDVLILLKDYRPGSRL